MPPKKTGTAAPKKSAATPSHPSYKDMIKDAILNLKERNGSSRQAIKKYVLANNKINVTSPNAFDSLFNRTLKAGVESGDFTQPKGPSGPVKIAKKEPKPAAPKAAPKKSTTKSAAPKKAAVPKKDSKAAPKKAAAKPKTAAAKPKKAPAAPAVSEKATVLGKTKSGRVTKTTAKPAAKKAAPKKPAAKKATPKKKTESATPAA